MTETGRQSEDRLQTMIEEVRLDAVQHPDPCGGGLATLLEAIQQHVQEEASIRKDAVCSRAGDCSWRPTCSTGGAAQPLNTALRTRSGSSMPT